MLDETIGETPERSTLDDVVDLQKLGLARFYPDLGEERHEALAERLKLFTRIPDFTHSQVALGAKADVVREALRRKASLSKSADAFVVLLRSERRRGKAGKKAHDDPP